MSQALDITIGQFSSAGLKLVNQDSHGVNVPERRLLNNKGLALAIADGISSSDVSQIASAAAVQGFLSDYFCTSDAWSVKTSAHKVLQSLNTWLYAQSRHNQLTGNLNRGYVCTFSALVIKSSTAHIFHTGDSRIYHCSEGQWEQLTNDHRYYTSSTQSHLTRALGIGPQLEFDYRTLTVKLGDIFILATDGVYEYITHNDVTKALNSEEDYELVAQHLANLALERGCNDNLTIQIAKIEQLPTLNETEVLNQVRELPFPPELMPRTILDGYEVLRQLYASPRSHVYLVRDVATQQTAVLKTPSIDKKEDVDYLERFLLEEWIARRITSAHVIKPLEHQRRPAYLYVVSEYIDGITLTQWMRDNPKPALTDVRNIAQQIARGLRAFHRLEMLHQDLKPDNIMIDVHGTVKIIDFGSTYVAGLNNTDLSRERLPILGTAQYTAPEYFIGKTANASADVFSLGIIVYQMLTGRLPYGVDIIKTSTPKDQSRLRMQPINQLSDTQRVPHWVDETIKKALTIDPQRRYQDVDEFIYDLHHPNRSLIEPTRQPLLQRNPLKFWQSTTAILSIVCLLLSYWLITR
ncbi:bifunctional protein-serine/threonine kinase/phosphatase [Marinomonas piezotolerans]|uniref:Bifunctional protein-serine/threonine kinase/phosphatase n=1 Tax=Marinomonas piezotolerans TaxID=2213058 RepID=A0A370U5Z6_9GAMM|nr:bifunctional protein-serine/threonine kinase/phosphatase [Marinomonas piezotolerans]RDL43199.1 bifunctional protein-serine/threonine kinase/phosphatase [Marinomonas piezotolerans]